MQLEKMRVDTRLKLLIVLSLVGLVVLSVLALVGLRSTMIDDRHEKVVALVDTVYSTIETLDKEVAAGSITLAEAQNIVKTYVRHARYDGTNYVFLVDKNSNYVVFPPEPKAEGIDVPHVRENKTRVGILNGIVAAGRAGGGGGFSITAGQNRPIPPPSTR
ncbi:hypothetical protein AGMMS49960_02500 [Betaproteobacteria bacterium]|nr:hypothetical protein AGMMS49960_02500 [Betaproteobacteria bacterium]